VMLDDVMSGLDNKSARAIIARLFSKEGHFRKAGISVIIVTHSRKKAKYTSSFCTDII
jgi:ATP-binding cassette subfamily C (CFTR/MRP) protein 1